jgi:hypothetical protein
VGAPRALNCLACLGCVLWLMRGVAAEPNATLSTSLTVEPTTAPTPDSAADPTSGAVPSVPFGTLDNPTGNPTGNATALAFTAGVGETDNVALAPSEGQSQTIAALGVDFALQRQERRLDGSVTGEFTYFNYLEHAFGKELFGRLDGTGTFAVVPDRFNWVVDDNFGEGLLDPFTPATPANLERINIVSTGPEVLLHFGEADFIGLIGRYSMADFQTSPFDSKRLTGRVTAGHQVTARSSVSLNADFERVLFDNTLLNTDYDRRRVYLAYEGKGARTDVSVDVGLAQANEGGLWRSEPMAQLSVKRDISGASTITASVGRQFTDAADAFQNLRSGAIGGIVIAPAAGTLANYLDDYATATWSFQYVRTTVGVSARWEKDTYDYAQYSSLDVTHGTVEVNAERRLTSIIGLQVLGSIVKTHYYNANYDAEDRLGGVGLSIHTGRRTDVRLRYDHLTRSASGVGTGYTENRVFLSAVLRAL